MAEIDVPLSRLRWGNTRRPDTWWVEPATVFTLLAAALAYLNWAAFQNAHYSFGNYLSPLYSPELWGSSHHALFGPKPGWIPSWVPWSPAFLILPFPAGFRLTCYYYRGAYYKAFWHDPPSCAVGEPRTGYRGEQKLPLILQNIHRYFLYAALVFLLFLSHDVWKGMWFAGEDGQEHFGIGVGTLVLALNVVMLAGYTFGCHSLRHMVGGVLDVMSRHPVRKKAYDCVSCFNRGHQRWAWGSLFVVAFTDFYVRMLSMGIWTDWRLL